MKNQGIVIITLNKLFISIVFLSIHSLVISQSQIDTLEIIKKSVTLQSISKHIELNQILVNDTFIVLEDNGILKTINDSILALNIPNFISCENILLQQKHYCNYRLIELTMSKRRGKIELRYYPKWRDSKGFHGYYSWLYIIIYIKFTKSDNGGWKINDLHFKDVEFNVNDDEYLKKKYILIQN